MNVPQPNPNVDASGMYAWWAWCWAQGLGSFVQAPLVSLLLGTMGAARILAVTVAQESAGNPDAVGDTDKPSASVGLFQFQPSTAQASGLAAGDRGVPSLALAAAVAHLEVALRSSPKWWLLAVPGVRWMAARALWRAGLSGPWSAFGYVFEAHEWRARKAIALTLPGWLLWSVPSSLVWWSVVSLVLVKLGLKRRARR